VCLSDAQDRALANEAARNYAFGAVTSIMEKPGFF